MQQEESNPSRIWYTKEHPNEPGTEALALVYHMRNGEYWTVLVWGGSVWVTPFGGEVEAEAVVRWRLLEPLKIERPDKRRPELTKLVELFEKLAPIQMDGKRHARGQCQHVLNKLQQAFPDEDPVHLTEGLIRRITAHPELNKVVTSFTYLNNNLGWILPRLINERKRSTQEKYRGGIAKLRED